MWFDREDGTAINPLGWMGGVKESADTEWLDPEEVYVVREEACVAGVKPS